MHCRRKDDISLLLIEDSGPERELMAYLLRAGGYCVIPARDGETGLELARQERVALVLCDVFLPGMDGYGVATRLKALPGVRRIPLLAVTNLNAIRDSEQLRAAGFDGYINKPIEAASFVRQVESFLALFSDAAARNRPRAPSPAAGRRILVVDDFPQDAERLRTSLEPHGYQITVASSPAQAMEQLASGHVDLIVSDIHLPEQDGFVFLSSVKASPEKRGIPFLLLSSVAWAQQDRPAVLKLPQTHFLRRPLDTGRLLAEVESSLMAGQEG